MTKFRTLILIAITVIGLWAACLLISLRVFDSWETRGQFGDIFGAVNALFSGMAFAGILFAIFLFREKHVEQIKGLAAQIEAIANELGQETANKAMHATCETYTRDGRR